MKMMIDQDGVVTGLEQIYPMTYSFKEISENGSDHEKIAAWIADNQEHLSTYMIVVESERLAQEHLDDPAYLHQTNHICVCSAEGDAIKDLTNRWFSDEEIENFIKKYNFPTKKFNFQEEPSDQRKFKFELEDALFRYQQNVVMVRNIIDHLEVAKYKLDDEGYPIEDETDDDEGYRLADSEEEIENNKKNLLERLLIPQVNSTYDRVYAMPEPLKGWDSRSFWHQFFFIENHKTQQVMYSRGHGGGSGSREANGRFAHTFAQLQKVYGIKTPTWHLIYDSHNILRCHATYDSFKSLRYDITGNYRWDWKESEKLFEGLFIEPVTRQNLW